MFNRFFVAAVLVGLYLTSRHNYLLFHSLAEIFSIVVAFSLFAIAWNSRKYIRNPYLLFVGVGYLFIAFLDLLHTLSYKGMAIFTDYDFYANQLWIAARYLESLTLVVAFFFLAGNRLPRIDLVFACYTLITGFLVASIFSWQIFPICFLEGSGQTPFKIVSEYVISGILVTALFLLWRNRDRFEAKVCRLLFWSIVCTILSELAFTFYISNYGFSNLVGHYLKIFSYMLIYQAIIKTDIENPLEVIFLELDQANRALREEIEVRKRAEEEIRTLEDILPICMHCKKIRDDQGYWNNLEKYIGERSGAQFSHGICPTCLEEHYPFLNDSDPV